MDLILIFGAVLIMAPWEVMKWLWCRVTGRWPEDPAYREPLVVWPSRPWREELRDQLAEFRDCTLGYSAEILKGIIGACRRMTPAPVRPYLRPLGRKLASFGQSD